MVNIYRKAYEIITTKTGEEMTEEEIELVSTASAFIPKVLHQYDNLPISKGLLRVAQIIEGGY